MTEPHEPAGSPAWLKKTRKVRLYLSKRPASKASALRRLHGEGLLANCLAWLEMNDLASCDRDKRWSLTPRGLESLTWIAIPQACVDTMHSLVRDIGEKYSAKASQILGGDQFGPGVPARDELFWTLRGRGMTVNQIAVRLGFSPERVANGIGRHSVRAMRRPA